MGTGAVVSNAVLAEIRGGVRDGLAAIRSEVPFAMAAVTRLGVTRRMCAVSISAVAFVDFTCGHVVPTAKLGSFGVEVAHW